MYLRDFDGASLGEQNIAAKVQVVIPADIVDFGRAGAEIGGHTVRVGASFKVDFCFLETVAELIYKVG